MSTPSPDCAVPADSLPTTLWNRGFIALLITQFLVTLNDNLFRWFIIPVGASCLGWGDRRSLIIGLGSVAMLAPFLVFASTAGYCTDRFSRRNVMIWVKALEILAILIGIAAILLHSVPGMLIVLMLLGIQGAFFSPCKYGSIPDLVPHEKLTSANGVIALTTMIAAVAGSVMGGTIADLTMVLDAEKIAVTGTGGTIRPWLWISALLGIAIIGFLSSLFIPKMPAVDPTAKFPFNPISQTSKDIYALFKIRPLFIAALASAFFWGLASIAQANIDKYGIDTLRVVQTYTSYLLAILSLGIGIGSLLAGYWSKHRIELGLVPIGAFGIAVCAFALALTPLSSAIGRTAALFSGSYIYAALTMTLLGIFAGIYDIPMAAFIQDRSPKEIRGRILAAVNFFSFSAMLLFSGVLYALFGDMMGLSSTTIWLILAVMVLLVCIAIAIHYIVPLILLISNVAFMLIYRRKVVGIENVPATGPAILIGNHVSYLDGFLLYSSIYREARFVAHADFLSRGPLPYLARRSRVIQLVPGKKVVHAIREAREALKNGELLVVFAEGGITRTGAIRYFEPGFLSFLKGNEDVPIIPFYIGGLFGSMFSYAKNGVMTFRPQKLKESVVLAFGKPLYHPRDPQQVQQVVEELAVDTMREHCRKRLRVPQRLMIRRIRRKRFKTIVVDSTGVELSGYKFLTGMLVARTLLRRHVLAADEKNVGALVPMSVGGMITNGALALDARCVVNLNPTFSPETINCCIRKADVKHVLTSRKLLQRFPDLKLDAEVICMEDLLPKASTWLKLSTLLQVILTPACLLERWMGLTGIKPEDNLTIIFTSGSTGEPKGVELTHENIGQCARAFLDTVAFRQDDVALGILPFFHAFGYVGNFWLVCLTGAKGVLHYSPLEARTVGELARKHACTFLCCTPTFLRNYYRRCPKEDFEKVELVLTGAEKLPLDLIEAWEAKYGIRPSEGFGMTELSPCASTNLPKSRQRGTWHPYLRDGSIGPPLPNTAIKIVDADTGEDLPPNEIGMMVVKGPIVMKGYYKEPEKTAQTIRNGWLWSGDIARRDPEGFIWITGRQSRISKIGGEMVPHILIEEKIQQIVAAAGPESQENDEAVNIAVTALPHETKGEHLIVLYRHLPLTPAEIRSAMLAENFPHLWIPAMRDFRQVESIPLLGTGKLDLRGIRKLAEELYKDTEAIDEKKPGE